MILSYILSSRSILELSEPEREREASLLCVATSQPARQLAGEQHVGQFALAVGEAAVVAALAVQVVEADPAEVMSQRRHHHHPGRSAALQLADQEVGEQEVACTHTHTHG